MVFKLLCKTGKTEKEFSKLEWIREARKEDEEISPFFQKNLKNIFPELELFINEKNTTKYHLKEARKFLDAICWYPKGQFFIILEYKSREQWKKMEQIRGYLGTVSSGKGDCHDLFDDLNTHFSKAKGISWKYQEINWNETKIIWICPELPSRELSSESWCYDNPNIIWVESQWYKSDDEEIAVGLESEDEENLLEKLTRKKEPKTIKTEIKKLSQLLQKIRGIDKRVKEQSEKFHEVALKKFALISKFYHPKKCFYLYDGLIKYYMKVGKKNKKIFWLTIKSSSPLRVYFSPEINKETVIIKDEKSFSEGLQIIRKILTKQKNKNE